MKDFVIIVGILSLWFALNRWILPAMGVPTCMSGACRVPSTATDTAGHATTVPAVSGENDSTESAEPGQPATVGPQEVEHRGDRGDAVASEAGELERSTP
jgi:hypothetical protein